MGIIRYGRTAQIGVYPGNQWGGYISYRGGGAGFPLDPDTQVAWRFAQDKSLTDLVRGLTLDFARASTATYVGADRLIKTALANEPRFNHDSVTGESLGLLVEEARTNRCLESEDFTTTWSTSNAAPVANQTTAPDGASTADKFVDDASTGTGQVRLLQSFGGIVAETSYAFSIFAKADQLDWLFIQIVGIGVYSAYFDLTNGTVGTTAGLDDSGIEDYGNGWYRCWVAFTTVVGETSFSGRLYVAEADLDTTVDLDGTSSIFVWGAQLEAGAFPTSYIPTTIASETRAFDFCSTDDLSWFDQTIGTFYAAIGPTLVPSTAFSYYAVLTPGASNTPNHTLGSTNQRDIRHITTHGGGGQNGLCSSGAGTYTDGRAFKAATAFQQNDMDGALNGAAFLITDTIVDFPLNTPMTRLTLGGSQAAVSVFNSHIREFGYANVRKDNTFLQQLTSP